MHRLQIAKVVLTRHARRNRKIHSSHPGLGCHLELRNSTCFPLAYHNSGYLFFLELYQLINRPDCQNMIVALYSELPTAGAN